MGVNTITISIQNFINELSSNSPTPGGGGASALVGAIGVSLCSMVTNLTTGKKKYAEYQMDLDAILIRTEASINRLLSLIRKDAEVFEPLSQAYNIPKEAPGRDDILEGALVTACTIPMEILQEVYSVTDIIESLLIKGSKLALSDVGVAASACRSAMESAALNVYINTKLMKNREYASDLNTKAVSILQDGIARCDMIYRQVTKELMLC